MTESGEGLVRVREQITVIAAGQTIALTDSPLFTSASTPWAGFLLEAHTARAVKADTWWGWHRTHVCVVTNGTLNFRVRHAKPNESVEARSGTAVVFPSGFGEARFSIGQSDCQFICVELDPSRVMRLLGRTGPAADGALLPQFGLRDSHVGSLLRSMAAEVAGGCLGGRLYGQSLSLALAAYLEGRFSADKLERKRAERKFAGSQVRRIVDYIRANLGEDLNLHHLASLVDMSPRQFFRLFSNTFESTPHRYVMNARVARAKELLGAGFLLVEVANAVGFASQSHFTDVFRKATGISPGRFRSGDGTQRAPQKDLKASLVPSERASTASRFNVEA
jgi:AraC family transcriptional regulator